MNVYLPYTAILPSEYQEVEYIESSGTQYINTGWKSTIYDTIETKFSTKSSTTDTNLYGGRGPNDSYGSTIQDLTVWINTSSGKGIAVHYPTNGNYGGLVDTGWVYTNNIIDTPTTLKITPQYVYVNDVIRYTFNVSRTPYTAGYNAFIFGRSQNGSPERLGKFRVYYLKIISNGTLVRDFVPCYRKSDNVIGMYDLVNSVFYTNSGTGTFSKGNDVTMTELKNAYIGNGLS